jgi:CO/xanthine dehydrogenase FAD-binding subunit
MQAFDYCAPATLAEALELLADGPGGPSSRVIAGGTDLMPKMRAGVLQPAMLVNIKRVPELHGLDFDPHTGLRLGALVTLRELVRAEPVRAHYPCLAAAAGWMASEQVRSFATVGGNLCNASPSADLAPPLLALDAQVVLASARGERRLPLDEFFLGPGRSALQAGELLKEMVVPPPDGLQVPEGGTTVYLKHAPRAFMDIAVVGVAVRVRLQDGVCTAARIALGAVAPVPLRARRAEDALAGAPLTDERVAAAAALAAEACAPIDDVRGAAWYRRRMVTVLVRRGIEEVLSRGDRPVAPTEGRKAE